MTHFQIEPATVHFNGGPFHGTGVTDGDPHVPANATARLVCISTDNGQRIPWAVKSLSQEDRWSMHRGADVPPASHRYRVERSEYLDGRLHIYCEYDGIVRG